MGPQPRQPAQSANRALDVGSDNGYSPDAPLFSAPDVAYVTVQKAAPHPQQVRGGGGGGGARWRDTGHAWACKPEPVKPLSPIHEPIGAGDLMQAKRPARCLDAGGPIGKSVSSTGRKKGG